MLEMPVTVLLSCHASVWKDCGWTISNAGSEREEPLPV